MDPAAGAPGRAKGTENAPVAADWLRQPDPTELRARREAARSRVIARYGERPGELTETALHEAGHVVVGLACGARIVEATINPRAGTAYSPASLGHATFVRLPDPQEDDCRLDSGWLQHQCAVNMAGGAAESLITPSPEKYGLASDLRWTEELISVLVDDAVVAADQVQHAMALAETILLRAPVLEQWFQLADLLLERKFLDRVAIYKALTGDLCGALHPKRDDVRCLHRPHHFAEHAMYVWTQPELGGRSPRERIAWGGWAPMPPPGRRRTKPGPKSPLLRKLQRAHDRIPTTAKPPIRARFPVSLLSVEVVGAKPPVPRKPANVDRAMQRQRNARAKALEALADEAPLTVASASDLISRIFDAAAASGLDIRSIGVQVSLGLVPRKGISRVVHDGRGKIYGVVADPDLAKLWAEQLRSRGRRAYDDPVSVARWSIDGLYRMEWRDA